MAGKAAEQQQGGGGGGAGHAVAGVDQRVLILAPRGRNAELIAGVVGRAGLPHVVCADVEHLCREMHGPAGVVILCEEALNRVGLDCLISTLAGQPPWSEIPLIVLTGGGKTTR